MISIDQGCNGNTRNPETDVVLLHKSLFDSLTTGRALPFCPDRRPSDIPVV
jgi:hypothetical protein